MIKVEHLRQVFNENRENEVVAVNDVTFTIEKGEFIAIVGHSGSGKTTLLNNLSGLLKPTSGKVTYNDLDIYELDSNQTSKFRNQNIGFVFQNYYLEPKFSAFENVSIPLFARKELSFAEIEKKVNDALDLVGLSNRKTHFAYQLSGGEKQRVAIARAIVTDAETIFADEPTGNLDSKNSAEIMDLLKKLNHSGKTIVLVTHKKEDTKLANRVITLIDGVIESIV